MTRAPGPWRRWPGRPSVRVYDDKDGLPQNTVMSLAVDAKGYLWAGTQDGLARYNGHAWEVVELPNRSRSNWVRCLLTTSDGALWVGTNGAGIARYHDGAWTVVETPGLPARNQIRCLLASASSNGAPAVWAGTNAGLLRVEHGRVVGVYEVATGLPGNAVSALAETIDGDGVRTLWVGTYGGGLAKLTKGVWGVLDTSSGLPDNFIWSLLAASRHDGRPVVWVGTQSGGLARIDGDRITVVDEAAGLPNNGVFSLLETEDRDGASVVWAGTMGGGLVRFAEEGWTVLDTSSGLPNNQVAALLEVVAGDGPRLLWAGTAGGGLARLCWDQWIAFDTSVGLPGDLVLSLCETEDGAGSRAVWIGTQEGGLARLEGDEVTVFDRSSGLPHDIVTSLLTTSSATGKHALWVGTWSGGLVRLEGGRVTATHDTSTGLPHNGVLSLLETTDPNGARTLWVGTEGGGIGRLAAGRWEAFDTSTGLARNNVFSLLETRDADGTSTIWAATFGGGLACYEGGRWRVEDTSTGLPNDSIYCVGEVRFDDGSRTLWIGTQGAGAAWRDLADPDGPWHCLSDATEPALPNNSVNQIRQDSQGRIYLFTNRGVARLTPHGASPDDGFELETFTTENGLPSNECNAGASMVDRSGRIWTGTIKGAAVLDPSRERLDRTPKPLYVECVAVGDEERDIAGQRLAHDENDLTFTFALLSFLGEGETCYRTQLVGFDRTETAWTATPRRIYTNLPEGHYEFVVWGRDWAGTVSGPVRVPFRIRPAPWRTWPAYALYLSGAAGLVYGGIRARLSVLERRNRDLEARIAERTSELAEKVRQLEASERRAQESEVRALELAEAARDANRAKSEFLSNMSHELRTPLNAVLGFVQLLERDQSLGSDQRRQVESIERSGEHLLSLINDVLSISKIEAGRLTLEERAFDLQLLIRSVEEMIRVRTDAKGLAFVVDAGDDLPRFVYGDEGKLRQVLVNLLGNAVKFTEDGGVALRVGRRAGRIAFEVEDTGRGIAGSETQILFQAFVQTESGRRAHEGTGLGLAISQSIVRLMGGEISVESEIGRGSIFAFSVDLPVAEREPTEPEVRRVVGLAEIASPPRILVVDDTEDNRRVLVGLLETVGFEVREASNGFEAVEVWDVWAPHLIWMDMRMPVMSGLEATREIRRREAASERARCAIVALTASAFSHDRRAIEAAGSDDFVTKPFRAATIFERLTRHLGVEYRHEEIAVEPEVWSEALDERRLEALPPELFAMLRDAVTVGDVREALDLIHRVGAVDGGLGQTLDGLVRAYRFDDLLDLLDRVVEGPVGRDERTDLGR